MFYQIHRGAAWPRDSKPFPSHLVPEKQDREAVLSYYACHQAVVFMLEFIAGVLGGIRPAILISIPSCIMLTQQDMVTDTLHVTFKTKGNKRHEGETIIHFKNPF